MDPAALHRLQQFLGIHDMTKAGSFVLVYPEDLRKLLQAYQELAEDEETRQLLAEDVRVDALSSDTL